ncbi:MAG: hypothetical protein PHF86_10210 [Candidatus Nanoarchaeia archaeon]|nr:hypothetical protein [Candidatus Nanoarchaeia archaeon]
MANDEMSESEIEDYFKNLKTIDKVLESECDRPKTFHEKKAEETAQDYYAERGIKLNLEQAKQRVEENYLKEIESVDVKEIALKLKKGFIELYGLINGANTCSGDAKYIAEQARSQVNCLSFSVEALQNEVKELKNNMKDLQNEINCLKLSNNKKCKTKIKKAK